MATTFQQVPLQYLGKIIGGGTPTSEKAHWDGGVPFVTPPDLNGLQGAPIQETARHLTELGVAKGSNEVSQGVLISCRAPVGYVGRITGRVSFNQGCKAIELDNETVSRFLSYVLTSKRNDLEVLANGTTFSEISSTSFGGLRVPLPPLDTQRAIADYLDRETSEIDAMLDKLDGLGRLLEERRRNAVESSFVDAAEHQVAPVGAVTFGHVGGTGLVGSQTPATDGELGVLKTSAISTGAYKPDENRSLESGELPEEYARVQKGMVLVNRLNSPSFVGASVYVDSEESNLYFTDKIWHLFIDQGQLNPMFFCYWTKTKAYRQNIMGTVVGTSASMLSLSYRDFERYRIPLPPLDEQERIVQHLDETTARIDAMLAKTQQLKDLLTERRSALITAAVTGQIEV